MSCGLRRKKHFFHKTWPVVTTHHPVNSEKEKNIFSPIFSFWENNDFGHVHLSGFQILGAWCFIFLRLTISFCTLCMKNVASVFAQKAWIKGCRKNLNHSVSNWLFQAINSAFTHLPKIETRFLLANSELKGTYHFQ